MSRTRWASMAAAVMAVATSAAAQESSAKTVSAPSGTNQRALTVTLTARDDGYELHSQTCATAPCTAAEKQRTPLPSLQPDEVAEAKLRAVALGHGHHLIHVDVGRGQSRWQALVAAPIASAASNQGREPTALVIWSGATPEQPMPGQASGSAVQFLTDNGKINVIVGDVRPELDQCGRGALLSPRLVDPRDLTLRGIKLQRLSREERARAEQVRAARVTAPQPPPLARLLTTAGASSATGNPAALTDGDPQTVWSEGRGGAGRGEFAVLRAPSEVPIVALSFVFRPPTASVAHGAAPRKFWLAANDRLLEVTVPEDGWKTPGQAYVVELTKPLTTSCLSIILEDAHVTGRDTQAQVSIAEVTARADVDGSVDLAGLVKSLGGASEESAKAAALLKHGGEPAFRAVLEGFSALNDGGQSRALEVLSSASCSSSMPLFAARMKTASEEDNKLALQVVRRCGRSGAVALGEVIKHGPGCAPGYRDEALCKASADSKGLGPGQLAAAEELALVAPAAAVDQLVPMLGNSDTETRRVLRDFIRRASRRRAGLEATVRWLENSELSYQSRLDLLRAVEAGLGKIAGPAGSAFSKLLPAEDVASRYLLVQPAASLAAAGNARAMQFLYDSILRDPSPMVRTRAAEAAREVPVLHRSLWTALEDPQMRVRAAAALSLQGSPAAVPYLVRRLKLDPWPLVRAHAAATLGSAGPSELADQALGFALGDDAMRVRARAAGALGERGAKSQAKALRELADTRSEQVPVRIEAVRALGQMCDRESIDLLTIFARRAGTPGSPEGASGLGTAAIGALGRLQPGDLRERIGPLLEASDIPMHVKLATAAALQSKGECR